MNDEPRGSPDLSIDDIAPILGRMQLEIVALTKEVHRLQALAAARDAEVRTE